MKRCKSLNDLNAYLARDGHISAHAIMAGCKSMKHMHAAMTDEPAPSTPAMQLGTLTHLAVLQPDLYADSVAVWTGARRAGKEWDAFSEANAAKYIVKQDDETQIRLLRAAVMANEYAADLIDRAACEVEFRWADDAYGKAKARLDMLDKDGAWMCDLKTCSDLAKFQRQFFSLEYPIQFAWHSIGANVAAAYCIAVETKSPYDCAVFLIPSMLLQFATRRAVGIATAYRAAEAAGKFAGIDEGAGITEIKVPDWYFDRGGAGDMLDLDDAIAEAGI